MYTKHQALSILRGWHERNTPLLLKLQLAAGAEPLFIKGRIAHLVSDEFIFGNPTLTILVNFSQVSFEKEELSKCIHYCIAEGFDVRIDAAIIVGTGRFVST